MSTSWATAAREVPGLDHDPCPGDTAAVRRLAAELRTRADGVSSAAATARAWQPVGWSGPAAASACDAISAAAERVGPLSRSLDDAASVLDGWAHELQQLQEEAAALGVATMELRRRHLLQDLAAPPPATPSDLMVRRHAQAAEREDLQRRVAELNARWLTAAGRRSAALDATAPPSALGWWRGTVDQVYDDYQDGVRREARYLGWTADATGAVSAASGAVAIIVPPTAVVTGPLALGTGAASAATQAELWAGADGSGEAVVVSTVGVAVSGVVSAGKGAVRAGSVAMKAFEAVEAANTGASVGQVTAALLNRRSDSTASGEVAGLDGGPVKVTVHDVASPWHVSHGLRGAGFVGVAVVPVTTRPAPADPSPQGGRRSPLGPPVPQGAPQGPRHAGSGRAPDQP